MPNLSNIGGGRHYAVATIALILTLIAGACAESAWSPSSQADSEDRFARTYPPGGATATLGLRIYLSDVVVRARIVAGGDGELRFSAIEYLKGSGSTDFVVVADTTERDIQWDDREAILFLSVPEKVEGTATPADNMSFTFTDTVPLNYDEYDRYDNPSLPQGFTIETRNPVWLPRVDSGGSSENAGGELRFITDAVSPTGVVSPTMSLSELRAMLSWQESRKYIKGYDSCVGTSLWYEQFLRDREETFGLTAYELEERQGPLKYEILSGMGKGVVISDYVTEAEEYQKVWIKEGPHARFFEAFIVDDDDNPENGFIPVDATARPLPQGVYSIWSRNQPSRYQPCNFDPIANGAILEITVTAPPGTRHEAFFDPTTLADGSIGVNAGEGVLEPFRFNAKAEILSLTWSDGKIVLMGNEYVSLHQRSLDFIDVDGSIRMSLHIADATPDFVSDIYTWDVADQPWREGDLLMLRIRKTDAGATIISQVRDLTMLIPTAIPTPTPTATSIPTPTAAPEVTRTPATLAHPESSQSGPIWILPFLAGPP